MKLEAARCAVCGLEDARALVDVVLVRAGGVRVTLCGTHALVHQRTGERARSVHELCAFTRDRRERDRRARELDELAASLTAAFAGERRSRDRRA
jgi:hypothetical protein